MADVDEKTKKARAERREKLLAWYEEKDLPPVIGDYELRIIDEQHDRIYYAFGWFHKSNGWKIRVLYDEETADYITGDLEEFKRLVKLLTPEAIEKELIHREKVSVLVEGKGFMVWDYEELLPEKIGHYVRVIAPKMPLLGLNGSYIIAAYECEEKDIGILFFYNMYRDEYYGELRAKGIPGIIHQYDAKSIEALEAAIEKHLMKDLKELYEHPVIED